MTKSILDLLLNLYILISFVYFGNHFYILHKVASRREVNYVQDVFEIFTLKQLRILYSVHPEAFYIGWTRVICVLDWIEYPERSYAISPTEEAYASRPSAKYVMFTWSIFSYIPFLLLKLLGRLEIQKYVKDREKIIRQVRENKQYIRNENGDK